MKHNAPHGSSAGCAGFSVLDLMIVVVIGAIIVTYVLGQLSSIQKPLVRTNAAQRLTTYVQKARSDSIRRHANENNRMAQILFSMRKLTT